MKPSFSPLPINVRLLIAPLVFVSAATFAETAHFSVITGGKNVGHVIAETKGNTTSIDFDYKNNGRGPTMKETIRSNAQGLPVEWKVKGASTFGSKVDEQFTQSGMKAEWTDSTGKGNAAITRAGLYVAQSGSPWSYNIYLHALMKAPGMTLAALPAGTLRLEKGETLSVSKTADAKGAARKDAINVTRYDMSGIDLLPTSLLVDAKGELFAVVDPGFIVIRKGYEAEEERLRNLAADWSTQRFVAMEKQIAHHYGTPVRIRNVRVFDPATSALTAPVSVLVMGHEIAAVEPLDSPPSKGETTIDGAGGTLVAGMHEMHGHLGQDGALLNLMAGITTVRDMGNDNAVLDRLISRIEAGEIGGPRVVRSGFIEGKSQYSANNGFVVASQEEAIDAVRWYGARGYWQIKIYNSMNPTWVPAMITEAHRLGMRVAGHVPAFATADDMIKAGYDEMTHINQFMLGWVMQPGEDTRTLFRLTALKRLPTLDINGAKVQHTIQMMVDGKKAIDPTLGIHELLLLHRDGETPAGAVDFLSHMPIGVQRDAKKALIDASVPADDAAYRAAFTKIMDTTRLLRERGVFIVFGTDTGGSFNYHRELELYQQIGMTAPEILKRATYDSARYLGQDQRSGSIEKGKLADFFLVPGDPTRDLKAIKTISMVVKNGTFYFPSEVYPKFGIEPFVAAPKVETATGK